MPRAGIADPRVPQRPRPMVPPRPDVREPASWTWAAQELVADAAHEAITGLLEDRHGDMSSSQLLAASNEFQAELDADPETKREIYERTAATINRMVPKTPSDKGIPVDRAEARLLLWLKIFDNY